MIRMIVIKILKNDLLIVGAAFLLMQLFELIDQTFDPTGDFFDLSLIRRLRFFDQRIIRKTDFIFYIFGDRRLVAINKHGII